jgi:hypothetical protein
VLNAEGFTPFLAYVKSFIVKRDELMAAIGRELNYQEYLHKERVANYIITNLSLFKSRADRDKAYVEHQRVAAVKWYLPAEQKRELHVRYFHTLVA